MSNIKKVLIIIIISILILCICCLSYLVAKRKAYKYTKEDVELLLSYLNNEIVLPSSLQEIYDVKKDGELNILDVVKMINIINGN